MIFGAKCQGCRMWTRIDDKDKMLALIMTGGSEDHYYCDECLINVTKATIKS